MSKRPGFFYNTLMGPLAQSSMCLTANPDTPFWWKIVLKIVSTVILSPRAAICFLRKSGNSIVINYLGGCLEQCRYVNPFRPAGVFYQFKLTDRSVIIGCNGSDI